jgi:hypothetical protein
VIARAPRALGIVLVACVGSACGGTAVLAPRAASDPSNDTPVVQAPDAPSDVVRVDGVVVHVGTYETLTETQRAYLARLERVIVAFASAPTPPVPYARDPAAFYAWTNTLDAHFAQLEQDTRALVQQHQRLPDESAEERRFHLLLTVIEERHVVRWYAAAVGGPPGGTAGCPSDPPSQYNAALDHLAHDAEACVQLLAGAAEPLAEASRACASYAAEAREALSHATPPHPDDCMEDMPSPGD